MVAKTHGHRYWQQSSARGATVRLLVCCVLLQKISNALLLSRALDGPCIRVIIPIAIPGSRHRPVQDLCIMYAPATSLVSVETEGGSKKLTNCHGRAALQRR